LIQSAMKNSMQSSVLFSMASREGSVVVVVVVVVVVMMVISVAVSEMTTVSVLKKNIVTCAIQHFYEKIFESSLDEKIDYSKSAVLVFTTVMFLKRDVSKIFCVTTNKYL